MKRFLFALFFLLAAPAAGQVVTDSVQITIEGNLAYVRIEVPDSSLTIGDSIQFVAFPEDSEGDPVTALVTWASSDPAVMSIDPETGMAVALAKTRGNPVWIYARAERIGDLLLASFRDGELTWGEGTVTVGEYIQYCAYMVDPDFHLLSEDPGPPTCPTVFLPRTEPAVSVFASVDRTHGRVRSLFVQ